MANPYRNTGRAGSSSPANNIGKHLLKPLIDAGKRIIKSFSNAPKQYKLSKETQEMITPELMKRNKNQIDNMRKWDQFKLGSPRNPKIETKTKILPSQNIVPGTTPPPRPMSARDAKFFNPDGSSKTGNLYSSHQSRMSSDKIKYKKSYHENEILDPPSGYYSSDGKGWPKPLSKGDL